MNILPYVNSRDIREHLQKIGYQFSALEAAWLIYQSRNTTLEERHNAWRRLIADYPDCPIPERVNTIAQPSLHRFLEEYIDMENRALERFRDPAGAVYQMVYHFSESDPVYERRVFSRFEPEKMHSVFEEEDEVRSIWCRRIPVDGSDDDALRSSFCVKLNESMQIMEVDPDVSLLADREEEILLRVLQGFWFDFPTPFQKGDILWDPRKPDGFCGGPFVCQSINLHGIADEKRMEYMRENADETDMTAHGLFVGAQYGVYSEVMNRYMDCEYFPKELSGVQQLLKPFSAYEKGDADAELLVHACRYMMLELEKKYTGLEFYTAETLKKVGIEKQ